MSHFDAFNNKVNRQPIWRTSLALLAPLFRAPQLVLGSFAKFSLKVIFVSKCNFWNSILIGKPLYLCRSFKICNKNISWAYNFKFNPAKRKIRSADSGLAGFMRKIRITADDYNHSSNKLWIIVHHTSYHKCECQKVCLVKHGSERPWRILLTN